MEIVIADASRPLFGSPPFPVGLLGKLANCITAEVTARLIIGAAFRFGLPGAGIPFGFRLLKANLAGTPGGTITSNRGLTFRKSAGKMQSNGHFQTLQQNFVCWQL